MNIKASLIKITTTISMATMTLVSTALSAMPASAAIVKNDITNYYITTNTAVYNSYKNNRRKTGQILHAGSVWRVFKTAKDSKNHKWYDLGKNQWIRARKAKSVSQAPQSLRINSTQSQQISNKEQNNVRSAYTLKAPVPSINQNNVDTTPLLSSSEANAKAWIAAHESGGSYSARNGQYIGKYQLTASYLHGDYSAANQERVADQYVKSRYGSWTAAKHYWMMHQSY